MVDPLFQLLGVKTSQVLGGIAGGSMRYLIVGGSWQQGVVCVTSGALASGYLTPSAYFLLVYYLPHLADPSTEGAAGFLVGLTAMLICRGFIKVAEKWSLRPTFPPTTKP